MNTVVFKLHSLIYTVTHVRIVVQILKDYSTVDICMIFLHTLKGIPRPPHMRYHLLTIVAYHSYDLINKNQISSVLGISTVQYIITQYFRITVYTYHRYLVIYHNPSSKQAQIRIL